MVEFVVIQKHVFILFISNSYMKEIQGDGVYKFVTLSLLYKTHTTLCRDRPSEKGSRPTVFRANPYVSNYSGDEEPGCGDDLRFNYRQPASYLYVKFVFFSWVFGSRSNDCCFNVFVKLICSSVWFVGTNGNNDADLARTKRFNKVKELGIYLVDCPAVATKVETFYNNLWKLGFLNHSAYTTKIWDEQWQICRTVPCWSPFIPSKGRCRYVCKNSEFEFQ
ncbi:hypothetical protein HanPI659440_Chr01g0008901 [Helianthus annuus]|nr:hypothetical protein HanPI659440_Chr01g0008901 [Helianthus annuus]